MAWQCVKREEDFMMWSGEQTKIKYKRIKTKRVHTRKYIQKRNKKKKIEKNRHQYLRYE